MWLPGDILLKADKMCMAHSLELRVPFLDKKVMEFAQHIPASFRVNESGNKQVLRHAANRVLPDEWATRPKKGFPVPLKFWLREQKYYDYVKEYFTAPWAGELFDTRASSWPCWMTITRAKRSIIARFTPRLRSLSGTSVISSMNRRI